MADPVPNITLNNGVEVPILGFGVYQIPPEDTEAAVATAHRASATATSTPPRPTATSERSAGGRARAVCPATSCSSRRSCGCSAHRVSRTPPRAFEASLRRLDWTTSTST